MRKYQLVAVGYTIWLTAVSLTPIKNIHLPSFNYADKIVHFFLYFFLLLFWFKALQKKQISNIYIVLVAITWGIVIEFLQEMYIPGRTGDIFDALANTAGSITALFVYKYFKL